MKEELVSESDIIRKQAIKTAYQAQIQLGRRHIQAMLNVSALEDVSMEELEGILAEFQTVS